MRKFRSGIRATRQSARPRAGAFLVIALVCLVVATAIVGAVLTLARMQRRQMTHEVESTQAEWLAHSGIERAAHRLRHDVTYAGETWSIAPEELFSDDAGQVTIQVLSDTNLTHSRVVTVEAVFPVGAATSVRRTRRATIAIFQE
jgi:type II secretory pathway component PulK